MFQHREFALYEFHELPTNRDVVLMSEDDMAAYEEALLEFFETGEYRDVGLVAPVALRTITDEALELSWYLVHHRFHEVRVTLPRSAFVACVGIPRWAELTRIFVNPAWLSELYRRNYSAFALIDAVGVTEQVTKARLNRQDLIQLRSLLDEVAARYPAISLVSFADSVLAKSHWWPGYASADDVVNAYEPESMIRLAEEVNSAYESCLGLGTYAVFAQGANDFYDDALLHVSASHNHVSLNSLGLPFAQLQSIETAARQAV